MKIKLSETNSSIIQDVIITKLKQISLDKGSVYHGIKKSEESFTEFGEAYFSFVNYDTIKGWKKHFKMTCNFVVPVGMIKIVLFDDRDNSSTKGIAQKIVFGNENYLRITIPPGVWYGFEGLSKEGNVILNVANIEHNPDEQINIPIDSDEIPIEWN